MRIRKYYVPLVVIGVSAAAVAGVSTVSADNPALDTVPVGWYGHGYRGHHRPPPAATVTRTVTRTVTATVTATVTPTVTVTKTVPPSSTSPTPTTSPSSTTPTPTPSTTSPTPTPAAVEWLSGAASKYAVDGSLATWRGEPVRIFGTWSDAQDGSAIAGSLDDPDLNGLNSSYALDIAVGAIWGNQTWNQAANGAYDEAWLSTLTNLKKKSAAHGILPQNIYIRFAHEMNGFWVPWAVRQGQEADFRKAITRFSTLRYQVFGETNAPKVVLCPNYGTTSGYADPRDLMVKFDDSDRRVVNVYAVDTYNGYPHRDNYDQIWSWMNSAGSGVPLTIEEHRRVALANGVPFAVGEWGNCGIDDPDQCGGGGGEAPAYMEAMNNYFRAHAGDLSNPQPGQFLYEIQFNLWDQYAIYGPEAHQPLTSAEYRDLTWGS